MSSKDSQNPSKYRYANLKNWLEHLAIEDGVASGVIAEVFEMSYKTVTSRLYDVGAKSIKKERDRDVAEDLKADLIKRGVLPPEAAWNLSRERQVDLLKEGYISHITVFSQKESES